ncbi:hypothetical protein RFI_21075 [Reticulomyxa filosa]|uniref:Uncharacterized protein n=1 Tax=Reticulomyxa filosa TaxID=46433 RepID=X6MQZ2_RETFI|nr:hypothetical protein RFI_21075 [Reticulomyxa filosa]|eukprot:ETO16279.1 hypothetical protein RFI_21075 [Reticulomyxa filosa]
MHPEERVSSYSDRKKKKRSTIEADRWQSLELKLNNRVMVKNETNGYERSAPSHISLSELEEAQYKEKTNMDKSRAFQTKRSPTGDSAHDPTGPMNKSRGHYEKRQSSGRRVDKGSGMLLTERMARKQPIRKDVDDNDDGDDSEEKGESDDDNHDDDDNDDDDNDNDDDDDDDDDQEKEKYQHSFQKQNIKLNNNNNNNDNGDDGFGYHPNQRIPRLLYNVHEATTPTNNKKQKKTKKRKDQDDART